MNADITAWRPPRPGELCKCGRPAIGVFIFADGREVPYCGRIEPDEDAS